MFNDTAGGWGPASLGAGAASTAAVHAANLPLSMNLITATALVPTAD